MKQEAVVAYSKEYSPLFTRYYYGDQIKGDEIGGAFSMHGEM
jgi:hypothetical protein